MKERVLKQNIRRSLILLLAVVMLITMLPVSAMATPSATDEGEGHHAHFALDPDLEIEKRVNVEGN